MVFFCKRAIPAPPRRDHMLSITRPKAVSSFDASLMVRDAQGRYVLATADQILEAERQAGLGMPELGWVSLDELATERGRLGQPIERDLHFQADKRLSAYARDARLAGRAVV